MALDGVHAQTKAPGNEEKIVEPHRFPNAFLGWPPSPCSHLHDDDDDDFRLDEFSDFDPEPDDFGEDETDGQA